MCETTPPGVHERWAHFRFAVVGKLLAAPPSRGQLRAELEQLAERTWKHPVSGEPTKFAFATVERWYLAARNARQDPVAALRRKIRKDAGRQRAINIAKCRQAVCYRLVCAGWVTSARSS